MGGGSQPAQTTQISKVELPAWVDQASQENYQLAKDISNRPLQQYGGPTVAGPSDMTTQGYNILRGVPGSGDTVSDIGTVSPTGILDATNPLYQQAQNLFTQSAGPLDINTYLNPYTNEVENRAVSNANTSLTQQLRGVSDAATKAGAFGGSRGAVESGVTRAQGIKNIGDLTAQLRQQGFDTAANLATQAQAGQRAAAGGLLSTAAGVQGSRVAQQNSLIAQQQQELAKRQADADLATKNAMSLLSAGSMDTAQQQQVLDAAAKKFYEARDYPLEGLNTRLAALGMSPYGKTDTTTKTSTAEQQGPDWASIGLGAFKMLPAMLPFMSMSDRETKTDIKRLGTDKATGLPMYAYRYKDDPKTYPKVVGPMAQDIEKKYPKAVKKIGKTRVVDINNLLEVLS